MTANHAPGRRRGLTVAAWLAVAGLAAAGTGCGRSLGAGAPPGVISAVGAENTYANVLAQIGGRYVHVTSVLDNPNTDPHTFESSPSVAEQVSAAQLIVQNGAGYDTFMNKIEQASPSASRKLITVQDVLHLPATSPNPHLWYSPATMPKVASVMAADLSQLAPAHRAYFQAHLRAFDSSLRPWLAAIAAFRAKYPHVTAATTEPVADYLLTAMGIDNVTPYTFQADVMHGVDPAPQDISAEDGFLTRHQVRLFCYNQQVVDSLTSSIRQTAQKAGVPVVGVYETMPTPGYRYQSWMLAEVRAIERAVADKISTQRL